VLESLFKSVADPVGGVNIAGFLLCLGVSMVIGLLIAGVYRYKSQYTRSFIGTLCVLPAVVCVVIMLVNGNIGAGVAVAGTFSLVRFRSAPGTAKEISAIFLAMAAGLATGMGYVAYALLFAVILGAFVLVLEKCNVGGKRNAFCKKTIRITIPENLDYAGVFDDLMAEYTSEAKLVSVKTTNMGSMYRLTYQVTLKDLGKEKEFIDHIRCRNGNLEISSSLQEMGWMEL